MLWDEELLLENEREMFKRATVEPVHQLRDDLCVRLSEVLHQPLAAYVSNWEQVVQQVKYLSSALTHYL